MSNLDIKEIYSLGDNIGTGPNPNEVMELLKENNVQLLAGNAEYYSSIGVAPFFNYFDVDKIANRDWTNKKLSKENLKLIKELPASIDLIVGGKKVSLCHFANDTRIDFILHSTWSYQEDIKCGEKAYEQFSYPNSPE